MHIPGGKKSLSEGGGVYDFFGPIYAFRHVHLPE